MQPLAADGAVTFFGWLRAFSGLGMVAIGAVGAIRAVRRLRAEERHAPPRAPDGVTAVGAG